MGIARKIGQRRVSTLRSSSSSKKKQSSFGLPTRHQQDIPKALQQVKQFIDQDEFESAYQLLLQLHSHHPDHLEILYLLGTVSLDLGQPEAAVHYFTLYLQYDPNNTEVLLHMAQLSPPEQSVPLYHQAIKGLETKKDCDSKISPVLVQAYCALAEMYLTDLCFDTQAPGLCYQYLTKAITLDPSIPDPHVMLASMYISKDELDLAWTALSKSLNLWWSSWLAWQHYGKTPNLPTYQLRKHTAQLCMELNRVSTSLEVLKSCLYELEDDVELWYLFGWASLLRAEQIKLGVPKNHFVLEVPEITEDHKKPAQTKQGQVEKVEEEEEEIVNDGLTDAMTCLMKAKKLYDLQCYDDPPLLQHILELVQSLESQGIQPESESEEEEGEAEERDLCDMDAGMEVVSFTDEDEDEDEDDWEEMEE